MDRFRWAERHDGLITTAIARATGQSKHQVEHEREVGRLRQVRRGVSVVNGASPTWQQAGLRGHIGPRWRSSAARRPTTTHIHVMSALTRQVVPPSAGPESPNAAGESGGIPWLS